MEGEPFLGVGDCYDSNVETFVAGKMAVSVVGVLGGMDVAERRKCFLRPCRVTSESLDPESKRKLGP